jgi:hypothetical protein
MIIRPSGIVLLAALMLFLAGAVKCVVPCYCNNGNVDIHEPQCVCACFDGFLMPHCRYTAEEMVRMQLYSSHPPETFSADMLQWSLSTALSIKDPAEIAFVWATPLPTRNWTVAFYNLKGVFAQQLLADFLGGSSWLGALGIIAVWEDVPSAAPMDVPLSRGVLYRDANGNVVSVDHLSWLFGSVCLVVALALLEKCSFSNTVHDEQGADAEEGEEEVLEDRPSARHGVTGGDAVSSSPAQSRRPTSANPLVTRGMEQTPSKLHEAQANFCSRSRM